MAKRTYSELSKLKTFDERFEYLKIGDKQIGEETFAGHRYLNQRLYRSDKWKRVRNEVIVRDLGRNMGLEGEEIGEGEEIIVHHMNPITREQVEELDDSIFDPEGLISVSHKTHNAIHYGTKETVDRYEERKLGDTKLW